MCGIVGMVDIRGQGGRTIDRGLLTQMNQSQSHRGPDEGELYIEAGIGLGHRRLSVIDLDTGSQPVFNEDRSVVIVFNGEIYNYLELTAELKLAGHRFSSRSDTEVIVHAWEEWGIDCLQRLRGMFAFGLWDRNRQTLFLARDHLGVKPLHYAVLSDGHLVFGSELKSLMCCRLLSRQLNPKAVEDYFAFGYIPEPKTIFEQAHKLAPGHYICLTPGSAGVSQQPYWDLPFVPHTRPIEAEIAEELIHRLNEAVQSQMSADVPLGAFLSGGVDSSAVVAMMAQTNPLRVNTCSIAFDDPDYDESAYASQVAERYQTRHRSRIVNTDSPELIGLLAQLYDEPFSDSSAIPTYLLCQLAREKVTVALSGDGGDENFAGYRRYRYAMAEQRLRSLMPSAIRRPLFGTLGKIYPKADWAPQFLRAKTTFEALSRDLVAGYFHGVAIMPDRQRAALFSPRFQSELQGYRAIDVMRAHAANSPTDDPLSLLQYLDFKTYLPGDILTKVDRASMAHSLEVRVPLLDHKLVEWISGLPSGLKLQRGVGKHIFKKSLRPHLSNEILYRKKKGFSVPLAAWLRGPLRPLLRESVLAPVMLDSGLFNSGYLHHLLDMHDNQRKDYSAALWSLLMFSLFLKHSLSRPAH